MEKAGVQVGLECGGDVWGGDLNSRAVGKWVVSGYGLNEKLRGGCGKRRALVLDPGPPPGSQREEDSAEEMGMETDMVQQWGRRKARRV